MKMKKFKKILSLAMALTLCLSLAIPAFGVEAQDSEEEYTIVLNEYEMWINEQLNPLEIDTGNESDNEYESFNYYEALYERAVMPEDNLKNLGYTEDQIAQLKEYAADPENSNIDFYATSSSVSLSFSAEKQTYTQYTDYYVYSTWTWSSMPLMSFTDAFAVAWQGVNKSAINIEVPCDAGYYSGQIIYRDANTGYNVKTDSATFVDPQNNIRCINIPMSKYYSGMTLWACGGSIDLILRVQNSWNFDYFNLRSSYGHSSVQVGVTIGVTPDSSGGLSFSFTPSIAAVIVPTSKSVRVSSIPHIINI